MEVPICSGGGKMNKMKTLPTILHYLGCLGILLGIAVLGLGNTPLSIVLFIGGVVFILIQCVIGVVVGKENSDLGEAGWPA